MGRRRNGKDTLDDAEQVETVFARKDRAAKWNLRVEDGAKKHFVWESGRVQFGTILARWCPELKRQHSAEA